jgi:hypothetical protein
MRNLVVKAPAVEQVEVVKRACPIVTGQAKPKPILERVFVGGVHYPPYQRQWDARREGLLALQVRLHESASIEPVSEYSWLHLMERWGEADELLQRLAQQVRHELPAQIGVLTDATIKRKVAEIGERQTVFLDRPLIASILETLKNQC